MFDAVNQTPASLFLAAAGLIACFAGYRLFRLVLAVFGFLGGAAAASAAFGGATGLTLVLTVLAGGLVGAAVMTAAYFFGVALAGAILGAAVAHLLIAGGDRDPTVLMVVLFAVGGALLTMVLQRYVLIVGTAFAGAWAAVAGALALLGRSGLDGTPVSRVWVPIPFDPLGDRWVSAGWLMLALAGLVVQLGWTAGDKGRLARRRTSRTSRK